MGPLNKSFSPVGKTEENAAGGREVAGDCKSLVPEVA